MSRNSGENTDGRNEDGKFALGNPGKPKGSRHKATQAAEAMLEGQQEALNQAAIDKALDGDVTALQICLDRIAPPRKDAPVSFDLPDIEKTEDAAKAVRSTRKAQTAKAYRKLQRRLHLRHLKEVRPIPQTGAPKSVAFPNEIAYF